MLNPGGGKTKEIRFWIYEGADPNAPPYKIYEFTENRRYEHAKRFLKDFRGIIHADAYAAYSELDKNSAVPIQWAACWAYARRKFFA
jgi:transposase